MVHRTRVSHSPDFGVWVLAALGLVGCSTEGQQTLPGSGISPSTTPVAAAPMVPITNPGAPMAGTTTAGSAGALANPMQPIVNPAMQPPTMTPDMAAGGATALPGAGGMAKPPLTPLVEPEYPDGPLMGTCPDSFTPRAGMNTGFKSDDKMRDFLVWLPNDMSKPAPVFVGITGTEQQSDNFITSGQLNTLTNDGWIVLAPVRLCTTEGRQQECLNGVGESTMKGWVWEPWNDGSMKDEWNNDAGPDVRYLENMVRCVAKQWPVDQRRIFLGGISAGGSFTNRNLTFNSKFWAGGVPASGMWYISAGNDSVNAGNADQLMDGWCCHRPVTEIQMYSSIVIVLFGGANDQYTTRGDNPVTVQYKSEAQASSNYYDSQSNVAVVTCEGTQGHLWPRTAVWDRWMAMTLASHPKGTPKSAFKLPPSPQGFKCNVGRFKDIF